MMHEKGRILINEAIAREKLTGIKRDCSYLPCHNGLEDCTFCYCPFYPCNENNTGGSIIFSSITKIQIWDCSSCVFPHLLENAKSIFEELLKSRKDFNLISRETLLVMRSEVLKKKSKI